MVGERPWRPELVRRHRRRRKLTHRTALLGLASGLTVVSVVGALLCVALVGPAVAAVYCGR